MGKVSTPFTIFGHTYVVERKSEPKLTGGTVSVKLTEIPHQEGYALPVDEGWLRELGVELISPSGPNLLPASFWEKVEISSDGFLIFHVY